MKCGQLWEHLRALAREVRQVRFCFEQRVAVGSNAC